MLYVIAVFYVDVLLKFSWVIFENIRKNAGLMTAPHVWAASFSWVLSYKSLVSSGNFPLARSKNHFSVGF